MDPTHKTLDSEAKCKTFPLPNGALKKHHHHHRRPAPEGAASMYRECLKNHAASLGGHAVDGCGEFMPSPSSNPADPTSLTCAACGCHRNFHRRLSAIADDGDEGDDEDDDGGGYGGDGHSSSPPPPSAPHMLLALSAGINSSAGPTATAVATNPVGPAGAGVLPRKRFRTKFSAEQKERMHELSEKLGWRMQKRDESMVEEYCREIGVGKGVFKVWMHNNKHNFTGSRRGDGGGTGGVGGGVGGNSGGGIEGNGSGGGGGGGEAECSNVGNGGGSTSSS